MSEALPSRRLLGFVSVTFVAYQPTGPLSQVIDRLWWLSETPAHAEERILPTGTQELVINLQADAFDIRGAGTAAVTRRFRGAMVSGAYRSYFVIDTRAHASLLGVHFKPGCARAILGLPPGELADQHVDLDVLWGPRARELQQRLAVAATPRERFRLVEAELERQIAQAPAPHPAVAFAIARLVHVRRRVGEVAVELGLTPRRFIELFTAEVGMTPKLYARTQRFQRALAHARKAAPDWAALALGAGYCDQPHLIRDFVDFSGYSPTELLRHTDPQLKEHHLAHSR